MPNWALAAMLLLVFGIGIAGGIFLGLQPRPPQVITIRFDPPVTVTITPTEPKP
jgi:hypothetical protein